LYSATQLGIISITVIATSIKDKIGGIKDKIGGIKDKIGGIKDKIGSNFRDWFFAPEENVMAYSTLSRIPSDVSGTSMSTRLPR
jgi:hypothetical protein